MLTEILKDLPGRGIGSVEAYPRRGRRLPAGNVWTGPEALFGGAGFQLVQDHPRRPRYRIELPAMAA